MKKLLLLVICVLLTASFAFMLPSCDAPDADDSLQEIELPESTLGMVFFLNDSEDGYRLADIAGCREKDIVVTTYEGLPVTEISENAFEDADIDTLLIGPDVKTFKRDAFLSSKRIGEVHITDLSAWCNAFFETYASNPIYISKNLYINGELLEELVIPDGITKINDSAFHDLRCLLRCLRSLTVGDHVTTIDMHAFAGCYSLMSVRLGSGIENVDGSAFESCYRLVEIFNGTNKNLLEDFQYSFLGEYALSISTDKNAPNKIKVQDDGFIFYVDGEDIRLINYIGEESYITLPDTYNGKSYVVNEQAFMGLDKLTGVVFSVTEIGENVFYECAKLEEIILGENVTKIAPLGLSPDYSEFYNLKFNMYEGSYYLGTATNPYFALVRAPITHEPVKLHPNTKILLTDSLNVYDAETVELPDGLFLFPKTPSHTVILPTL